MTSTRLAPLALLLLVPLGLDTLEPGVDPLEPERPLASLVPEHCLVYLESRGLSDVLERGLADPLVERLLATELATELLKGAQASPAELVAFADTMAGTPVLPGLAGLTRHGVALAVAPGGQGKLVVLLRGEDELDTEELLHKAFDLIEVKIGAPGALDSPQRTIRGADFWQLGEGCVARRESLLVLANDEGLLRDVLDLAADGNARGLLTKGTFVAPDTSAEGELLHAWLDLAALEGAGGEGLRELRGLASNPGVQALLGSGVATLGSARRLTATLRTEGEGLVLALLGAEASPAKPLLPGTREGAAPSLPASGDDVLSAVVYRDFAGMFEHRVSLFPPETLPGFAKAISDLGLFFGGRDIGADVLPHVSPWMRVVARPVTFEEGLRPEIPLPAAALVAVVDTPEIGQDFVTAFQTLMSILNVEAAQKGGRMLRLSLGLEGTTQVTSARFPRPGPEDGVDLSYNLQPACALVGQRLILGTHEDLVRRLVRETEQAGSSAARPAGERLSLDGPAVARVLADNFETLVMDKVLKEAVTREEAEKELGGLRLLIASLARVDLSSAHPTPGQVLLRLEVELAEAPR